MSCLRVVPRYVRRWTLIVQNLTGELWSIVTVSFLWSWPRSATRRELHVGHEPEGHDSGPDVFGAPYLPRSNRGISADATTRSHAQSDNSNRISAWASEMADSSPDLLTGMPQIRIELKLNHITRTEVFHMWSNLIWTQSVVYTEGVCGCGGLLSLVLFPWKRVHNCNYDPNHPQNQPLTHQVL